MLPLLHLYLSALTEAMSTDVPLHILTSRTSLISFVPGAKHPEITFMGLEMVVHPLESVILTKYFAGMLV